MNRLLRVHLSLFTVALIYGSVFSLAKEVMPHYMQPFGLIVLRIGISALLFLLFHTLFIKEKVQKAHLRQMAICAVFGVGANMLLFFKGLSITRPIQGAVLMMFTPIFVVIFDALLNKNRVTPTRLSGVLLACTGAILLIGGTGLQFNADTIWGDLAVATNAIIYAFYLVYAKRLTRIYSPMTISKWTFLFGLLFVLPFGAGDVANTAFSHFTASVWAIIAFIVIGSTFLTYLLNAWALQHASSSLVGAYIYLQPILAMLIAVSAGKDELTLEKIIFTLIIFAGVYLVSYRAVPKTKEA